MEQQCDPGLARRGAPYSLAIVPEKDRQEYTDPTTESAVEQRWRPVCERHGAAILGVARVPTGDVQLNLDGVDWVLTPLGSGERGVPAAVFNRWRALEAEGVPFMYWLWGEEQRPRPAFFPLPEPSRFRLGDWFTSPATTWSQPVVTRLDPIVVGVIPTTPGRGVWVLIGRWFH